jgi:shikimate kinase
LKKQDSKQQADNANIFLTGFMGVGKTTIGGFLAEKLNRKFYDLDHEIAEYMNLPVFDIIEKFGLEYFRKIENQKLAYLCAQKDAVIALGGGTLISNKNLKQVQKSGYLVYLMAGPKAIFNRIKASFDRPLLKNMDEKTFERLFDERKVGYNKAQFCIQTDDLLPDQVCSRILTEVRK